MTAAAGQTNIAFASSLQLSSPTACIDLLLSTTRAPEAALFAKTYAPSQTSRVVKVWKQQLVDAKKVKLAGMVGDPEVDTEAFEGWEEILRREEMGDGIVEIEDVVQEIAQIELAPQEEEDEEEEDEEEVYGSSRPFPPLCAGLIVRS